MLQNGRIFPPEWPEWEVDMPTFICHNTATHGIVMKLSYKKIEHDEG